MNKPILYLVRAEFKKMFEISQLVSIVYPLIHDSYRKDKISYYTFGRTEGLQCIKGYLVISRGTKLIK
jgi:hypothetical protein